MATFPKMLVDPEEMLIERQAAGMCGWAEKTLKMRRYREKRAGVKPSLPYVKFGRAIRYKRADVIAFIESQFRYVTDARAKPKRARRSRRREA